MDDPEGCRVTVVAKRGPSIKFDLAILLMTLFTGVFPDLQSNQFGIATGEWRVTRHTDHCT